MIWVTEQISGIYNCQQWGEQEPAACVIQNAPILTHCIPCIEKKARDQFSIALGRGSKGLAVCSLFFTTNLQKKSCKIKQKKNANHSFPRKKSGETKVGMNMNPHMLLTQLCNHQGLTQDHMNCQVSSSIGMQYEITPPLSTSQTHSTLSSPFR